MDCQIMKFQLSLLLIALLTACGGGSSTTSTVNSAPAPVVSVTLSATKIYIGETVKVNWVSTNATSCTGSDNISGVQLTSNAVDFTPTISGQFKYTITCTGLGGSAVNSQTVTVENPIQTFSGAQSSSLISNSNGDGNYMASIGAFRFNTGVWGQKSASSFAFSMSGTVDIKNTTLNNAEFLWEAVSNSTPGIVAFNNVTLGKHPGWASSSHPSFPAQISTMPNIVVSGNMKSVCFTMCAYGSIMNAFVMSTPNPTSADLSALINVGTEFLVVTENSDGAPNPNNPGYVGNSMINGIEYKVYYNGFKSSWNNIGYSPIKQSPEININLKDLMNDAINRGYIKSTDHLLSIEFGTEIVFGKGSTVIRNLKIN